MHLICRFPIQESSHAIIARLWFCTILTCSATCWLSFLEFCYHIDPTESRNRWNYCISCKLQFWERENVGPYDVLDGTLSWVCSYVLLLEQTSTPYPIDVPILSQESNIFRRRNDRTNASFNQYNILIDLFSHLLSLFWTPVGKRSYKIVPVIIDWLMNRFSRKRL